MNLWPKNIFNTLPQPLDTGVAAGIRTSDELSLYKNVLDENVSGSLSEVDFELHVNLCKIRIFTQIRLCQKLARKSEPRSPSKLVFNCSAVKTHHFRTVSGLYHQIHRDDVRAHWLTEFQLV